MSSSSAETVANIEDLLSQILLRMPLRSVVRFKIVSKRWLSLIISNHKLICRQRNISAFFSSKINQEDFKFISLNQEETSPSISCNPFKSLAQLQGVKDFFGRSHGLEILQSCNGLFLFGTAGCVSRRIYVVNPTTNEFLCLLCPSIKEQNRDDSFKIVRYGLAFEPSRSPHYKVVCVSNNVALLTRLVYRGFRREQHVHIDIYSSETREWKSLEKVPAFSFDNRSREGAVYCNGAIHWISTQNWGTPFRRRDGLIGFERKECDVLHYLDIGKEHWLVAAATPPLPQLVNNFPSEILELAHKYFGESGGHLYMIETYHHYSTQIEVMEMARDYSEWVVKYYVDLNPVRAALPTPQESSPFVVLNYFSREQEGVNQREDSASLLLYRPGKVISYYLRDMTYQTIQTSVELTNKQLIILDGVSFHPYMESIASI